MKLGDFIGDFYQQISLNFVPCNASSGRGRAIKGGVYQSVHIHCNAKKLCVHSCYTFQVTCPIATGDARLCNRSDHQFETPI